MLLMSAFFESGPARWRRSCHSKKTVLGERADRLRVHEVEHFFRYKACGGFIDARDLAWIEEHEGPVPHPARDQAQ
jgi:hypothetical protein